MHAGGVQHAHGLLLAHVHEHVDVRLTVPAAIEVLGERQRVDSLVQAVLEVLLAGGLGAEDVTAVVRIDHDLALLQHPAIGGSLPVVVLHDAHATLRAGAGHHGEREGRRVGGLARRDVRGRDGDGRRLRNTLRRAVNRSGSGREGQTGGQRRGGGERSETSSGGGDVHVGLAHEELDRFGRVGQHGGGGVLHVIEMELDQTDLQRLRGRAVEREAVLIVRHVIVGQREAQRLVHVGEHDALALVQHVPLRVVVRSAERPLVRTARLDASRGGNRIRIDEIATLVRVRQLHIGGQRHGGPLRATLAVERVRHSLARQIGGVVRVRHALEVADRRLEHQQGEAREVIGEGFVLRRENHLHGDGHLAGAGQRVDREGNAVVGRRVRGRLLRAHGQHLLAVHVENVAVASANTHFVGSELGHIARHGHVRTVETRSDSRADLGERAGNSTFPGHGSIGTVPIVGRSVRIAPSRGGRMLEVS